MVKRQFVQIAPPRDDGYNPEQAAPAMGRSPVDVQERVPRSQPQAGPLLPRSNGYNPEQAAPAMGRSPVDVQERVPRSQLQAGPPLPRSNGYNPEQAAPAMGRSPVDVQERVPRSLPPQPVPRLSGTGLLSGWKSTEMRYPNPAGNGNPRSVTEIDTLIQRAIPNLAVAQPPNRNGVGPMPYEQRLLLEQGRMQAVVPMQHPPANQMYPRQQPFILGPGSTGVPGWDQRGLAPFVATPMGVPGRLGRNRSIPKWARIGLFVMLVFLVLGGSAAGYYYYSFSAPIGSIVNQQVPRLKGDSDPNQGRNTGGNILNGGRLNILLLGSDTDAKFTHPDGSHTYLAQTDIVVSIDPTTKNITMLSIPRDFYINVPGSGMHKLDEAYALGGTALSRLTISQDFGIPINYYAWVGLDGFVKVINTVNGVDVDVTHPITGDDYPNDVGTNSNDPYGFKRLYLAPGPQHLAGLDALEYVRSRHADLVGDFGRSARQQQILTQLKNKLNNPNIIGQLPALASALNGYVKTDMQLNDVFNLMRFARNIDTSKINRVTLGPPYSSVTNVSGKSIVAPHCELIVPKLREIFGSSVATKCNITGDSGNSPSLASTGQGSFIPNSVTQTTSQIADTSPLSLNVDSSDPARIHSLLDLLFLVVFETPEAVQA